MKKKITRNANPVPKTIEIMEVISVSELAKKMNLRASDIIAKLLAMGMMVNINQQVDADTAGILAAEYGAEVKIVSLYDETVIETEADNEAYMESRPPVVTVGDTLTTARPSFLMLSAVRMWLQASSGVLPNTSVPTP